MFQFRNILVLSSVGILLCLFLGKSQNDVNISRSIIHSTVKRTSSSEHVGPNNRKDSGVDSKSNRTRTGSTGSNSSGKKTTEKYENLYIFGLCAHVI